MISIDRDRVDETGQKILPNRAWFARAQTATDAAIADPGTHEINRGIYAADSVRAALEELFHNKCAYCERPLPDDFDVEHYRPKGRVAENQDHPGYYWLAYTWTNLLPSCGPCNQRRKDKPIWGDLRYANTGGKSDQFPLFDEAKRSMDPKGNIATEEPLLLDPCVDNPEDCIRYLIDGEITGENDRGNATIRICNLKRRRRRIARGKVIARAIRWIKLIQNSTNQCSADQTTTLKNFFISECLADECNYLGAARFVTKYPELFGM